MTRKYSEKLIKLRGDKKISKYYCLTVDEIFFYGGAWQIMMIATFSRS